MLTKEQMKKIIEGYSGKVKHQYRPDFGNENLSYLVTALLSLNNTRRNPN